MGSLDDILSFYENDKSPFNNDGAYDFTTDPKLIHGQLIEKKVFDIITDKKLKHEVKSERKSIWGKTGNIYVEYQQMKYGKWVDSGITITQADYWWVVLKDYDDNEPLLGVMLFDVSQLKKRIKLLLKRGVAKMVEKPKTDDGSATKGVIVPLTSLFLYENEYETYMKNYTKNRLKNIKRI